MGIDKTVKSKKVGNIELKRCVLKKKISIPSRSTDTVTLLAVLEHLDHPMEILKECYRILKPNGVLLLTVPSPRNKPLLKVLSALGLVRKEMIDQHKNYFTHSQLRSMFKQNGFNNIVIENFELELNTFAKART